MLSTAAFFRSTAGIVGFARLRGQRTVPAGVWLDGLIAGAGLAALGGAFVFQPVQASATGSPAAVATELAYPICDLLLAALTVGVLALRGWRIDCTWALLGGGFLLLAVADCMYAVQVAAGFEQSQPAHELGLRRRARLAGVCGLAGGRGDPPAA